jgi:hypothetical protein
MADVTSAEFAAATACGEVRLRGPRAVTAHCDRRRNRVIVRLTTGFEIGFAPRDAQGLEKASAEDQTQIEVTELGLGIHFPKLDADHHVPAVLQGMLGSRRWMAARLGSAGGRVRNPAKAAASRENGKRGDRPKAAATADR